MPDDQDHEWLAERLRDPPGWTERDYATMRFLARNQRESLATMHPLDKQGRASVERAAEKIEAAIATYDGLRRN